MSTYIKPEEHCEKRVYRSGGSFRGSQCSKKAVVFTDKGRFCKVHDPDEVKRRSEESYKRMTDKWAGEREIAEQTAKASMVGDYIRKTDPMRFAELLELAKGKR